MVRRMTRSSGARLWQSGGAGHTWNCERAAPADGANCAGVRGLAGGVPGVFEMTLVGDLGALLFGFSSPEVQAALRAVPAADYGVVVALDYTDLGSRA